MFPFPQSSIIEHFQFFGNDERHKPICKTLFEHDEPSDTAVTILKRMDAFKSLVEIKDIFKSFLFLGIIFGQQFLNLLMNIRGSTGFTPSRFIRQAFVLSDVEPRFL